LAVGHRPIGVAGGVVAAADSDPADADRTRRYWTSGRKKIEKSE
jgi:hypothetical protein